MRNDNNDDMMITIVVISHIRIHVFDII